MSVRGTIPNEVTWPPREVTYMLPGKRSLTENLSLSAAKNILYKIIGEKMIGMNKSSRDAEEKEKEKRGRIFASSACISR